MKRSFLRTCLRWFGAVAASTVLVGAARAQCPNNIQFLEIGDRLAELRFDTDSPGSSPRFRVRLGESPSSLPAALDPTTPGDWGGSPPQSQIPTRQRTLTGLAPSSTYYFDVQVAAPSAPTVMGNWDLCETQHCPSLGAQPGGYECVQVGDKRRPRFTTAPAQGTPPLLPNPPVNLPVSDTLPSVTGSTFTVDLDEAGLCLNLQNRLNAAAAANASLVHEVVVPAGGVCRPESEGRIGYQLPRKSGSGEVIVRCNADPKLLPPPGIRMDPTFRSPQGCSIESNISNLNDNDEPLIKVETAGCPNNTPCTEGWRIVGFNLRFADHRKVVRNLWPVLAVASDGQLTLEGDFRGKQFLDGMQINLPGIENDYAHRSCLVQPVTYNASTNTSRFRCGTSAIGTYTGGGFISDRISTPLVGCEAGEDPICETAEAHPFGNYFEFNLLSVQGDTATTAAPHQFVPFRGVLVSDASGPCNGFYTVKSVNKSQGIVRLRPDPTGDCTGGKIREVGPVSIFDTAGPGAFNANNVHILDVVDSTHIRLLGSALEGTTIGGWMAVDPPLFVQMAVLGRCVRCRLDRVLVEGVGTPGRVRFGFGWNRPPDTDYSAQGAVIHSWIQNLGSWFPVHPVTGEAARSSVFSVLSATTTVHSVTNARDLQIRNVGHFATPGISVFSQNGESTCAEDIDVDRGLFFIPRSRIGGLSEAQGRYFPSRHFFEFKCGRRVSIRGVDFRQNPANSQPSGSILALSVQNGRDLEAPGSGSLDFLFENNTLWENSGAIDIVGPGSRISRTESTRRIRIAQNLVRTNRPVWKTAPSGEQGDIPEPWGILPYYGEFIRDETPSTDIIVENNTVAELMGGDTSFLKLGGQYDGTSVFRHNVFPFSRLFFGGITGSTSAYEPQTTGFAGFNGWINHYRRGSVTPDPFSEWDNVAIPCVDNTSSSQFDLQMRTVNNEWAQANTDFACEGGCPSNFNTEIIGGANQTCLSRQAAFFKENMDYGRPTQPDFPDYGADIEELRDVMGLVRDLKVDLSLETTISISYRAPDSAACYVDYGVDKLFWTTDFDRISDGGGGVNRSVDLVDLNPETTYHFRVLCSADQPRGVFTTGGGVPI